MKNYKHASTEGQKIVLSFFKKRMKEKGITQKELSEILKVGVTTLIRYLKIETPMPFGIYLEICGALELRPYLVPKELDDTQMNYVDFN